MAKYEQFHSQKKGLALTLWSTSTTTSRPYSSLVACRATYVVDRRFFGHFLGRWRGQCANTLIHIHTSESCTATIHATSMQGGRGFKCWKTWKIQKTSNLNTGGREHYWPYWISWMVAILNNQRWWPPKIQNFISRVYLEYLRSLTYYWWRGAYKHWRSITEWPLLPILIPSNQ